MTDRWTGKACLALGLLIGLAFSADRAEAGAYPRDPGTWLVISQFDYAVSDTKGYDPQGHQTGRGTYTQIEFSPYIEYGLTPDWTLGLQPRTQLASLKNDAGGQGGTSAGLAQVNLFARYTVYRWDFDVLAVQAQYGVPGFAGRNNPQVASPWAEYEARLLYGHDFTLSDDLGGFVDAEIAYRLNAGHSADQIRTDLTLGLRPSPEWLVLAQAFLTFGLRNNVGNGNDYDQYRLQLSVVRQLTDDIWLQVGGWHDVGGRNVARSNAGIVALWFRF